MYAIVEIAGQQFKVAKDRKVFVHRLAEKEGEKVTFYNVMLLDDDGKITVGAPAIDGAAVEAKIVKHLKGDKVIVFKKKRRKGYRVKNGHRQLLTQISIENIISSGAEKPAPAETEVKKTERQATPKPKTAAEAPEAEPKEKAVAKEETAPEAVAPEVTEKETKPKEKKTPEKEATAESAEDLSKKTVAQLKEMAKAKGIIGISSMKKADLIAALSE